MSHSTVLFFVMLVPLIVWLGLFSYLLMVDRAIRRMEIRIEEKEVL
ncbi:MAG TPA: CcmD family protein [Chthonomonas sp.]|jgi:CcmD family protein|nr:CcmD family protein [Chthonomonas sp.]HLH81363.1 CcmD family protein [Chthonomonas sp.]HLI49887.1 CcmD family protein [Chthonomonas sp.]